MTSQPAFIITVDTEPDNQWVNETFDKTENARYIPRFQELCEKYDFAPVYLTEYNIAKDRFFIDYINKKLSENKCEVGMHLHPWSTPPFVRLTSNDFKNKPYVTEYPREIIEKKVESLINLLRSNFNAEISSHRAGRWAINTEYLKILKKHGITIDCSIVPYHKMPPSSKESQSGIVDYSDCKKLDLYEIDNDNFKKSGKSGIFEVPLTAFDLYPFLRPIVSKINAKISNAYFHPIKLRPEQGNAKELLKIVAIALKKKLPFIQFMIHSSELMPHCSLAFPDEESIERLYKDIEKLFSCISLHFKGTTLKQYVEQSTGSNV
jgi:hypothetical protein